MYFHDLYGKPYPLLWLTDGDEWMFHLQKQSTDEHGVNGWSMSTGKNSKDFPYPYYELSLNGSSEITSKLRLVPLRDDLGIYIFLANESKIDEAQIALFKSLIEGASSRVGVSHTKQNWYSVLKPCGQANEGNYKLRTKINLNNLTLVTADKNYIEQKPSFGQMSAYSIHHSRPIVVYGEGHGYNWESIAGKTNKELHTICALLSLAWRGLWCVAQSPSLGGLNRNVAIPETNMPPGTDLRGYKANKLSIKKKSAPAWMNQALSIVNGSEEVKHALFSYYEALKLQESHPSHSLMAGVTCIEILGRLVLRRDCEYDHGPKARFTAGVRAIIKDHKKAKAIIDKYGARNETTHEGKLHGSEILTGTYFTGIFTSPESEMIFAYTDVRAVLDTASKLLEGIVRNRIKIQPK